MIDAAFALMVAMQCPAGTPTSCAIGAATHLLIEQHESGGLNVFNWLHDTAPRYYTASGYYQITDSTWRDGASMAGVNLSEYPTAISAPYIVQKRVADALLSRYGIRPWSMDSPLMADLRKTGLQALAPIPTGQKQKLPTKSTTLADQVR